MSPKKSSRRSSPKKETANGSSDLAPKSSGSGLKLRLKVKESIPSAVSDESSEKSSVQSNVSDVVTAVPVVESNKQTLIPKIKLNFSRSNESTNVIKVPGKRGRPKKDKTAVLAAAIAASQPNEVESEERKSRRRAAEDKIKRANDVNVISSVDSTEVLKGRRGRKPKNFDEEEELGDLRKRRRRSRKILDNSTEEGTLNSKSSDFIDITEGSTNQNRSSKMINNNNGSNMILGNNSITGGVNQASSSIPYSPHENEFIQRSKTFLNISMQHDSFLYTSILGNGMFEVEKFKGFEEVVDKLVPFHMGFSAGQYTEDELNGMKCTEDNKIEDHMNLFKNLQDRYRSVIHSQSTKKVSTELLLLEQKLCLEEEKFLLVKLKNEYTSKFMRSSASSIGFGGASSSSGRSSVVPSRSDSVLNNE